ncbi:MAG: hypothetical protein Q8S10_12305 [Thiobacillus sp.]|nr:hypothetical protein [Thiobacillus sp.]
MDRIRLRTIQRSEFRDPRPFLVEIRELESRVAGSDLSSKAKQLRTKSLNGWRETREAALFCYGMGQRIGQPVFLSRGESQDYDFIATWVVGETQHFAPVQLKEVVPTDLNATASIESVIRSLTKYVDSTDLTVAIHLNQQVRFDPRMLVVPTLPIAALWVFGSISPDQSEWGLWGNFLEEPEGTRFAYPV